VINEGAGTGAASRIEGIEFSGKTGSAQRISNDLRKSGLLDADEKRSQARNQRGSVLPAQLPVGVDRDFEHGFWNAS
jgi:cell division protein FtsI/penicillin-binding protein 2